jgi:hypothetical protein
MAMMLFNEMYQQYIITTMIMIDILNLGIFPVRLAICESQQTCWPFAARHLVYRGPYDPTPKKKAKMIWPIIFQYPRYIEMIDRYL